MLTRKTVNLWMREPLDINDLKDQQKIRNFASKMKNLYLEKKNNSNCLNWLSSDE
jgi:hypothetical protein